jgi:hypothetical protein
MPTAQEIITNAMLEIGALIQGEVPTGDEAAFCLSKLQRMMDAWKTRSLYVYTVSQNRYTFPASQQSYTIGPVGADITAPRPTHITKANIILTAVSPEVVVPLAILDDEQWASIRVRNISVTIPSAMYNDGAFPNSTLYFWGYPSVLNDLELWTWLQMAAPTTLATIMALPPGYEDAMTLSLAESLCGPFGKSVPIDLRVSAQKARSFIQGMNSKAPYIVTRDDGIPNDVGMRTTFNYRTGSFRT